ncbi:MAG: hypothetical protein M1837_002215 [Sclerophora amabilis]|nr:MAG: hypothetical protein M1837_002215 [Sclerophora amabilis]
MPGFFSKVFKSKDGSGEAPKAKKNAPQGVSAVSPQKPPWKDAWERKEVDPEEVQVLLRGCTTELKSRALDMPFLLLPFRPASDPSATRSFIRNFFQAAAEGGEQFLRQRLQHELRLTEPIVLCSVLKWCWSRLPGGIVTWEAYELFRVGEQDSQLARDSFATFIPLSVDSDARTKIIFDFFDLLAAIAAHGKSNGLGGRKLSRLAGWWAFEHAGAGDGFDGGYKSWMRAADATSHLFFAYLRSLSPDSVQGINGISSLPISLQSLVQATEYPPETPALMQRTITKVVMIVDAVSPTPFSLLRRAKHFEYRDDDTALQTFSNVEDPVDTLTDECRRVLRCISSANQSQASDSNASTSLRDASWSRFEDIGFSSMMEESEHDAEDELASRRRQRPQGLSTSPNSRTHDLGRPTTPSWADFLSSGFVDEPGNRGPAPLLLPPDKILPPIETSRAKSSQSHKRQAESDLEPGELASINKMSLDDSFWWVWMTSLAGEELTERKAVFGRCAVIETDITGGGWLIMEEQVKGTAPAPDEGAYLVEKKSRFGLTKRGRQGKKPSKKDPLPGGDHLYKSGPSVPISKTSIGPDQHARIQAAAAALQEKQRLQPEEDRMGATRRGRNDDAYSTRTNSVMTLQPMIMSEAGPAMKWASKFDKDTIREAYLANNSAGRGQDAHLTNGSANGNGALTPSKPAFPRAQSSTDRGLPALPQDTSNLPEPGASFAPAPPSKDRTPPSKNSPLPPAPLPPTPAAEMPSPPAESMTKAAEVPLPTEQKPSPLGNETPPGSHPPEPEPSDQIPETLLHPVSSRPETKTKKNKLQKNKGGGFKAVFGRRKKEPTEPPAAAPQSSAQNGQPAPPQHTIKRRFSNFRKKSSPAPSPTPPMEMEIPDAKASVAVSTASVTPTSSPPNEAIEVSPPIPDQEMSRVNTSEERHAAQAFSSFDQGPLEDVPAFAPEDPPERHDSPIRVEEPQVREPEDPGIVGDDVSEVSEKSLDVNREASAQDRWAQIRKNAAERAATRASEEQSRPSQSARTDDGETSGEETIESRVARIKARVAELTGNMEGNPNGKASTK